MRIGIDLGGTKIEGMALHADGREISRLRLPTPRGDYDATIRAVVDVVAALDSRSAEGAEIGASFGGGKASVGVGTPGSVSRRSGGMKNCNSTWLNGKPLQRDLENALGRQVRIANDADCFALSEATDGAAAGAESVFGVILGTGVGGGIVAHGRLLGGPNGICGEWGHNPLPYVGTHEPGGTPCYCGRRDCIETYLSGPGFKRLFASSDGRDLDPDEIARQAEAGDPSCVAAIAGYCDRLARALAVVINVLDPHVIVLGGGLSNIPALLRDVPKKWGAYVFSDTVETRLVRAVHGDSSGVRGAAWLWPLCP